MVLEGVCGIPRAPAGVYWDGGIIDYQYDDAGNLVGVTRPDGSSTHAVYNDLHLPVTVTEADGVVWSHAYDERGNRIATRNPLGAETHYEYDDSAFLIGVGVALAVGVYGTLTGLDRERAFYPTALVVIASYYVLFAVMSGSLSALGPELVIFALFAAVAAWGFRRDLRLVIAGLVAHAVLDFFHGGIVSNPGVPTWWPAWCAAYDLAAPVYLAVLVRRGRVARHAVAR